MNTHKIALSMTAVLLGIAALSLPAFAQEAKSQEEMAPLMIELPKPMFLGTPKNIRTPNLERQTGKPRGKFMAPKDAVIISKDKRVTASDEDPIIGSAKLITDGDKEGADGSFVEYGPGLQWAQIDLGEVCEIYAIVLWHYHSQARVYFDVVINTAEDEKFENGVQTIFNNDHDNSAGLGVGKEKEYIEVSDGKLIDAKRATTRYLRLYSSGNTSSDLNHYIEVEVWGKPLKD
jgi:hypothetical protein